jgi:hypothetical protein
MKAPAKVIPVFVFAVVVYETLHGISFHVTTEGLSSIRIGQRALASGGWSVFNAENWFRDSGSGIVKTVDRFYYLNRITPLIPVSDFHRLEKIERIQPEFLSDEGKWKSRRSAISESRESKCRPTLS